MFRNFFSVIFEAWGGLSWGGWIPPETAPHGQQPT